ncbi:reverse transcriptase [Gossypium australe]|uniref:Reverse transcriptase n=1 Tax=Gossypium australe TaxID=47621 RepID=A0A5B6X0Y4_9ROSI|nr:reverse transcriptase [Gossypium australe]
MGVDVLRFCHEALRETKNVYNINETLLVMIPKIENPCDMTNFRPMSLCRVVYKIVSKVLVNRLKEVLPISELVHYLRSSKNGPNKGYVVKLDMSKAYDQVEWRFLKKVLLKFGFGSEWVNKIMNCVRTVRYRVKCNMSLTNVIKPERGFRQVDLLSHYLFLFCMDVLSRIMLNAQEKHKIKGIRASRDGPRINHLFFADDALLFVRNYRSEVEA